jgi:SAM-dependent methyltransferase
MLTGENMQKLNMKEFLYMTWLRPENVVWDTIASFLIGGELIKAHNILEVGIGNGYFTFMTLGGKFHKEYDWYYNVNVEDYNDSKDIYDHFNVVDITRYVLEYPGTRLSYGVDHKHKLLKQVEQLNIVDKLILHDANEFIELPDVDTIYSNIIYWLKDPIHILQNFQKILNPKGKIILTFPNRDFFRYCPSYRRENPLQKLLNRGRAENILWSMDLADFEKTLNEKTSLNIIQNRKFLCELTLNIWDVGLRPLSPHLIKMANNLDKAKRTEIKEEWCENVIKYAEEVLAFEMERGGKEGGFNFVVLEN